MCVGNFHKKICKKKRSAVFRFFFGITLFLIIAGPEHACAKQITLRLLIWDGYAPVAVRNSFSRIIKSTYGVDLQFDITYASNPDDFFDRLRIGDVDLISPAHNLPKDSRFNLTTNGLTLPINLRNIPNYKNLRHDLSRQSWAMEGDEVFAVPIVNGIYGLAYNSEKIKIPPKSWDIFWNPEYKGKYSVNKDYYELNIYISSLALGYNKKDIFHYDRIKGPDLEDKLNGLAKNSGFFWQGFDKPEHYRNLSLATTWRVVFPGDNEIFKNWHIAVPKEGTPSWTDALMISHTLEDRPLVKKLPKTGSTIFWSLTFRQTALQNSSAPVL
jgi:spermidine/putrescine transport system substrate-binding protein